MLVRAWNLFSGNTLPPGRRAYVREMVELIAADRPEIVCLQEVPAWALGSIGEWADMQAVTARTRRPKLGPLPVPAALGRTITSLNAGFFRSSLGGQGNAILLPKDATVRQRKQITLNTNPFTEAEADKLGIDRKYARRWERERRVCHLAKIEFASRRRLLVANMHATSNPGELRMADAELRRAASFVDRAAEVEEIVIFAGDFNITHEGSETLRGLTSREDDRYSASGPQINHILVRGAPVSVVRVWPDEERLYDGKLLSDHAPVEVVIETEPKARPAVEPPAGPD